MSPKKRHRHSIRIFGGYQPLRCRVIAATKVSASRYGDAPLFAEDE